MENLFSHPDSARHPGTSPISGEHGTAHDSDSLHEGPTLPSDRANVQRQVALLCAGAESSGVDQRTIASADLARQESVSADTATETLRFCTSLGLFTGARGKFAVTDAGWAIAQRWREDETQARLLLQAQFLPHRWATAAWDSMRDAPVPVELLAKRLQGDLPGKPRRGVYLVEWLVLALLVHRGRHGLVWPAPALAAVAGTGGPAFSAPRPAPEQVPLPEPAALFGLTNSELRKLAADRYCAVLDNLTQFLELAPAT
ncbi:hypothetical protein [Streptomyces sp. NPDC002619]|uniref:hypothetical protein n=1 Tax=Streptomyces sp. NPDC002619 TaxID=3364655 RepID=UPI0036C43F21